MSLTISNSSSSATATKRHIDSSEPDGPDQKRTFHGSPLHQFIEELSERQNQLCEHIHGRLINSYKILLLAHASPEENKGALQERLNKSLTSQLEILEDWLLRLKPFSKVFPQGKNAEKQDPGLPLQIHNPLNAEKPLQLDSRNEYDSIKEKYSQVSECLQSLLYQVRQVNRAFALLQEQKGKNIENRIRQLVKTRPRDLWLFGKVGCEQS